MNNLPMKKRWSKNEMDQRLMKSTTSQFYHFLIFILTNFPFVTYKIFSLRYKCSLSLSLYHLFSFSLLHLFISVVGLNQSIFDTLSQLTSSSLHIYVYSYRHLHESLREGTCEENFGRRKDTYKVRWPTHRLTLISFN